MDTAQSLAITPRDIKILQLVYAYDTCSADHLCARFFGASSTPGKYGPQVTCYRRIARLRQAGYLTGYRLPSLSGMGSGKLLLGLGPRGRKLLAEHLQLSRSELRRLKQVVTPVLGAHHLAVCDVRLALELACEGRAGVSLDWTSERELRNQPVIKVRDPRSQPQGVAAPEIPLIPDSQFSIALADGAEQTFQLEVDLGTIPSKRMRSKLAGYLALGMDAPILWVVPDQRRLEAIANWALKLSEGLQTDPSIFWITTRAEISSQAVLSPIWRIVGGPAAHALIPSQEIAGGPRPSIDVGQARISAAVLTLAEGSGWRL
jgi:hypothetical protein